VDGVLVEGNNGEKEASLTAMVENKPTILLRSDGDAVTAAAPAAPPPGPEPCWFCPEYVPAPAAPCAAPEPDISGS